MRVGPSKSAGIRLKRALSGTPHPLLRAPSPRKVGFISYGEVVVTVTSGKAANPPECNAKREKRELQLFSAFKLLHEFELKEISAEMHGDLKRIFIHRPVRHFHRLIDVFNRVSVTE